MTMIKSFHANVPSLPPWKSQKTKKFLMSLWSVEIKHWREMGHFFFDFNKHLSDEIARCIKHLLNWRCRNIKKLLWHRGLPGILQTTKMESFATIINCYKSLNIMRMFSVLDIYRSPGYVSMVLFRIWSIIMLSQQLKLNKTYFGG